MKKTIDEESINITVRDFALMLQIIDATAQRGAIRGDEMFEVGMLRNKLQGFLEYAQKTREPAEQEEEADDGQDSESVEAAS